MLDLRQHFLAPRRHAICQIGVSYITVCQFGYTSAWHAVCQIGFRHLVRHDVIVSPVCQISKITFTVCQIGACEFEEHSLCGGIMSTNVEEGDQRCFGCTRSKPAKCDMGLRKEANLSGVKSPMTMKFLSILYC